MGWCSYGLRLLSGGMIRGAYCRLAPDAGVRAVPVRLLLLGLPFRSSWLAADDIDPLHVGACRSLLRRRRRQAAVGRARR